MSLDALGYIKADPVASRILDKVAREVMGWDGVKRADQKSQVGFSRRHPFVALWVPEQYLRRHMAPVVLSIMARRRISSPRFKEVVEPSPGRFTHHIELSSEGDVDPVVVGWLKEAWIDAA